MSEPNPVRLDKWLWAARLFKTRAQAKRAIEGGKVRCDGGRAKPSREVAPGAELEITTGSVQLTVVVTALSDRRRGAPEARLLYRETDASVARREAEAKVRRGERTRAPSPGRRPTKLERRALARARRAGDEGD